MNDNVRNLFPLSSLQTDAKSKEKGDIELTMNHNDNNVSITDTALKQEFTIKATEFTNSKDKEKKKVRKPRAKKANKLSVDQVRENHVISEKKRREIIRSIYDELVEIVPDLKEAENRSELVIYMKTINYIKWLYKKNASLRSQIAMKDNTKAQSLPATMVWNLEDSNT